MTSPEEKYYDAMNTLLAPVRWVKSLVQTVLLLVIAVVIGLAYPIIQWCNGEPLTLTSFVVLFLTALALFTFFYAPYYLIFGGIASVVLFAAFCTSELLASLSGNEFFLLVFAFLAVGILQRYVRHRLFDPPKEPKAKQLSFVAQLNQVRRERRTREYDAMSPDEREAMTRIYGDNYLTWPE